MYCVSVLLPFFGQGALTSPHGTGEGQYLSHLKQEEKIMPRLCLIRTSFPGSQAISWNTVTVY